MKRKFFTLFLSLVACLCLCFGLAACGGDDDGASKDDVEGTYYLYVDGELDLNNSITLSGGKWTSSFGMGGGTYKVSGTNITLRPDGTSATDLSSSFRGTVSDGMMKLTPPASMGGEEGVFYKQGKQPGATTTPGGNTPSTTQRTVTFHANGGLFDPDTNNESEELEVRVNNGSTVNMPDPPVRPGYEFVGWYEDSYGNHEFDFDSAIRSDRDLYAKWELGFNEHEVTYELNYEGAERVVRPTVDGLVDFTPERDGYIFNGWWRSNGNTENGSYVLTSPWDPQSRVTSDSLTLYASWIAEDDAVSRLDTPVVSEADGVFTWQPVENATLYEVGYRQYDSYSDDWNTTTVSNPTWTVPYGLSMGAYTVRVRALGDGYHFVNSAYATVSYQHHVLSRTHIEFDQTSAILSWAAVPHADTYRLSIDGSDVQTYYAYSTSLLQYDMSNYDAGSHSVTIVAEASSYTSSTYSGTVTKLRLKTPELELRVNRSYYDYGYHVQWEAVTGADTYEIYVNGEKEYSTSDLYYDFYNSSVLWTADGVAEIEVYAFDSNFDHIVSIPATTGELHKLHALTLSTNDDEASLSISGYLASDSVTVSFNLNDGSYGNFVSSQIVNSSTGLVYPEIPTRYNYIFGGWYTDSLCSGEPYDFSAPVTEDTTLYAKWLYYNSAVPVAMNTHQTVSVSSRGSSNTYYAFVPLVSGNVVIYSQVSGSFDTYCTLYNSGWGEITNDDQSGSNDQFRISQYLNAGELYYFCPSGYSTSGTLTFYLEQGNAIPAAGGRFTDRPIFGTNGAADKAYVPAGTEITVSVSGSLYSFGGWYNGSEMVSTNYSYTFTMPDEDVDLEARWLTEHTLTVSSQTGGTVEKDLTEVTVSFDLNGYSGTPVPSQRVTEVSGLTYPSMPSRPNYIFGGWYTDSSCSGEPFDFTAPVKEDTTLYAKWVEYDDGAIPVAMNSNRTVSVADKNSEGTYYAFVPLVTGEVVIYSQVSGSFDTYCYLYDSNKQQIAYDDDGYGGSGNQFKLTRTLTAGELYYFKPAGYNSSGTLTFYLQQEDAIPEAGGVLDPIDWQGDGALIEYGLGVKVTAVASQGYVFDGWYANGSWVSNDLEYTYTMPNYDVELVAHWRRG